MASKTQLIRDYREKHPDSSPKQVAQALKSHDISAQYVSTVLFQDKKKRSKNKGGKKKKVDPIQKLKAAKVFVDLCGSPKEARDAINTLAELTK